MARFADHQYVEAAQRLYEAKIREEGRIEIDDLDTPMPTGRVSRAAAEGGAYVLAWIWVDDGQVRTPKRRVGR
jgi:hypothetical protein